ncbi:MAG TPA: hypothetical protein PKH92_05420, partial [Anaerolineaceae bacterium]|nr:hypothetical protein [Longilinea sp.]HOD04468.1 hypothetical protein [Anaerolineaceae bacterium]
NLAFASGPIGVLNFVNRLWRLTGRSNAGIAGEIVAENFSARLVNCRDWRQQKLRTHLAPRLQKIVDHFLI